MLSGGWGGRQETTGHRAAARTAPPARPLHPANRRRRQRNSGGSSGGSSLAVAATRQADDVRDVAGGGRQPGLLVGAAVEERAHRHGPAAKLREHLRGGESKGCPAVSQSGRRWGVQRTCDAAGWHHMHEARDTRDWRAASLERQAWRQLGQTQTARPLPPTFCWTWRRDSGGSCMPGHGGLLASLTLARAATAGGWEGGGEGRRRAGRCRAPQRCSTTAATHGWRMQSQHSMHAAGGRGQGHPQL